MEYASKSYLVIVDYLSHWIEIRPLSYKNSSSVIDCMQEVFTRFGYPVIIIADNNPFKSHECTEYYKSKDITIITSSPHYPRSNGMAEKAVNISKNIVKKAMEDGRDYRDYLMSYNNSPLSGLPVSPSQILNSRNIRSNIPSCSSYLEPRVVTNI
ncbi:integrase catalytic domain-containing protein, partial [Listeria welshimeri]|uniref:integrase catalytic domain-containing protein n=1 Tax=Listeria welshimeri TaxID=1643 RepID=UPI001888FA45